MKMIFFFAALYLMADRMHAQSLSDFKTTNFISLTVPVNFLGQFKYLETGNTVQERSVLSVPHDASVLSSFPNVVSSVTVYKADNDGGLTIMGNNLSARSSVYEVIYDFVQTQTLQLLDGNDTSRSVYFALIGVSVRMVARIKTRSAGINLTSLSSLGIAASRKKLTGTLEVRTNGIGSQRINALIPVTSDLSSTSIENALQSVATIKSHIYDADTKITPQFLAFSASASGDIAKFDYKQLCNNMYSYSFSDSKKN
jgi:hypothetical protein